MVASLATNASLMCARSPAQETDDGIARTKPEIIAIVVRSRHVETLRTADPINQTVNLAARPALVEDCDALSNAFARVHCCEGGGV